MKCYQAKAGELAKHWYFINAEGMVVGRLAAQIAPILMGKHRPTYTPHIDTGDYVIVTNVDKVVFTGQKWRQKSYQRYSGYPGGQKEEAAWKLFQRRPERILELAVQRMMPKNKIGRHMLAKLKLYVGPQHPHQAQQPISLEALSGRPAPAGAVFVPPPAPQEKSKTKSKEKGPRSRAPKAGTAVASSEVPVPSTAVAPETLALAPSPGAAAAPEALPAPEAHLALEEASSGPSVQTHTEEVAQAAPPSPPQDEPSSATPTAVEPEVSPAAAEPPSDAS